MNERFVWNFEINTTQNKPIHDDAIDELRWESRYFWPKESIITLNHLSQESLQLSEWKIKQEHDEYLLFDSLNLKYRDHELYYKPVVKITPLAIGYDKKINLTTADPSTPLNHRTYPDVKSLLTAIPLNTHRIRLNKERLSIKLPTHPPIKIELGRIQIEGETHYTVCLQGRSNHLVSKLSESIVGQKKPMDYIQFLKQWNKS